MKGWVANTHHDWFDFLASRQAIWPEVNFLTPSDYFAFRGQPGSPFFFRLKAPRNRIGGFGFVERFDRLPEWLAWECFGVGNGAATFELMAGRLADIRASSNIRGGSALQQIGCITLANAVFFPPDKWVDQPADWKTSNLRYAGYSLGEGEGRRLWEQCTIAAAGVDASTRTDRVAETASRWGEPSLTRTRLGQAAFRLAVTDAYQRACAATGEHSLPALEAAHIRPFSKDGPHTVSNGLLLRSDLHRLFDRGYVSIDPSYRLVVSERLREHFQNGRSYYPLHGQPLSLPRQASDQPDLELLRWHRDNLFLG